MVFSVDFFPLVLSGAGTGEHRAQGNVAGHISRRDTRPRWTGSGLAFESSMEFTGNLVARQ